MRKLLSISILSLSSSIAFSSSLQFEGELDIKIQPHSSTISSAKPMEFKLPRVKLSSKAKSALLKNLKTYPRSALQRHSLSAELPQKVDLGMEGTPVLNQGRHGSCVTFAITGAINATLGAGDYVSQLCSLELGSWLAIHNELDYSGWNGTWGPEVLKQFMEYGAISKNHQKLHGCSGVNSYPLDNDEDEGQPMSASDYKQHSIPLSSLIEWQPLLAAKEAFMPSHDPAQMIWMTKEHLAKGNRLTFGTLLDVNIDNAGAAGSYKAPHDTWMITPQIILDAVYGDIYAGHEMVIIGYDDNALVSDDEGNVNKGVFILRNSWSEYAGDQGNYYVSYEHFAFLTDEIQVIRLKK